MTSPPGKHAEVADYALPGMPRHLKRAFADTQESQEDLRRRNPKEWVGLMDSMNIAHEELTKRDAKEIDWTDPGQLPDDQDQATGTFNIAPESGHDSVKWFFNANKQLKDDIRIMLLLSEGGADMDGDIVSQALQNGSNGDIIDARIRFNRGIYSKELTRVPVSDLLFMFPFLGAVAAQAEARNIQRIFIPMLDIIAARMGKDGAKERLDARAAKFCDLDKPEYIASAKLCIHLLKEGMDCPTDALGVLEPWRWKHTQTNDFAKTKFSNALTDFVCTMSSGRVVTVETIWSRMTNQKPFPGKNARSGLVSWIKNLLMNVGMSMLMEGSVRALEAKRAVDGNHAQLPRDRLEITGTNMDATIAIAAYMDPQIVWPSEAWASRSREIRNRIVDDQVRRKAAVAVNGQALRLM